MWVLRGKAFPGFTWISVRESGAGKNSHENERGREREKDRDGEREGERQRALHLLASCPVLDLG